MKCGSKNILKLQYGSKNIIAAYWGNKKIWKQHTTPEQDINTILESIISGEDLDNMNELLSNIESSNQNFTDINNQLEEIIERDEIIEMITFTVLGHEYQVQEGMTFGDWLDTEEKFYSVFDSSYNIYSDWYTGYPPATCAIGWINPEIYPNTVIHNGDIYSPPIMP